MDSTKATALYVMEKPEKYSPVTKLIASIKFDSLKK